VKSLLAPIFAIDKTPGNERVFGEGFKKTFRRHLLGVIGTSTGILGQTAYNDPQQMACGRHLTET
jgi:hypothetical protein